MGGISVKFGSKSLKASLANKLANQAHAKAKAAIEEASTHANAIVPVDTGSLKRSIRTKSIRDKNQVGYRLIMGGKDYSNSRMAGGGTGNLVTYAIIAEIRYNPTMTRAMFRALQELLRP